MSRRRRPSISPNLFPFLAVLVCTLGTLILLLALVSKDADDSAKQLVEKETGAAKRFAEEERWEAEKLVGYRREQTEELEKKRSELAHLEDHSRRIREELEQLQQEIAATQSDQDEATTQEIRTKLVSLKKQTDREKEEIAKLKFERDGRPPRVVIVPYKGTNGTDRRPIYLECTASAVIIQPEGVRITAEQLDGPMGPGNPLDAALRAVRSHWQKNDPTAPPPYPLLLVRPSGIHAYAASRVAMSTWDDQFGYELIPEDLELAFPKKDITLEVLVLNAIKDAVSRGQQRVAAAPSRYPQFSASGNNGNAGRSSGRGTGISGGRSEGMGTGSGSGSVPGTDSGSALSSGAKLKSGTGNKIGGSESGFGGDGSGNGLGNRSGNFTIDGSDLAFNGSDNGEGKGGESGFDGPGNRGQTGEPGKSTDASTGTSTGTSTGELTGTSGLEGATGAAASSDSLAAGGTGDANNPLNEPGGENASGQMSGSATGGGTSGSASPNGTQQPAMSADPGRPSGSMQNSQPFDPHEKTFSETMQQPRSTKSGNNSNQPPGTEPVLRAGNNWALPESMLNRNGTAIVRQMDMRCTSNGYVLFPETPRDQARVFEIREGQVEPAVIELATAIRDRVAGWGVALQNGRWEPVLVVQVVDGADARFNELKIMLRGSGVRVERGTVR